MKTDTFREFSSKLSLLYAGYFGAVRATLFPKAYRPARPQRAPTAAEQQREQRWENEGGA